MTHGQVLLRIYLAGGLIGCAWAGPPLRVAQAETSTYPLLQIDAAGRASGGLLKDLGDKLAERLGTNAQHLTFSRRRLEDSVQQGTADVGCYLSPNWSDRYAKSGQWSIATLPQIERMVVPLGKPIPKAIPEDLIGKRIAVIFGYHYPRIQPLFDEGKAARIDVNRVGQLFRLLEQGSADVLISSETEISGYLNTNPGDKTRFTVSAANFSMVETQCLVSPKSPWPLGRINAVLESMSTDGTLRKMAERYGMSM